MTDELQKKSIYELDPLPNNISVDDGVLILDTKEKSYKVTIDRIFKEYEPRLNELIDFQILLNTSIWIKFKFHSTTYNPQERQLGVGKAIKGTDRYNQSSKNFSAEWKLIDKENNIWLWLVTDGTNLSNAFVYGDGTGVGIPMISGADYITGIPEDLTYVEGGTVESLKENADEWRGGKSIDPSDYVPNCEILDWNLEKATDITSFIGTNVWFKNNLVGTLPIIKSNSLTNLSYSFNRCWNVTSIEGIDLPNCTQGATNAFMSMMALTEIPTIKSFHKTGQLNNTFNGCLRVNKTSIENAYNVLNSITTATHGSCFNKCGYLIDEHALDNIPTSWGGNKA